MQMANKATINWELPEYIGSENMQYKYLTGRQYGSTSRREGFLESCSCTACCHHFLSRGSFVNTNTQYHGKQYTNLWQKK